MKYTTIQQAGMLTAVSCLLSYHGIIVDDHDIAMGMEAPYLFIQENNQYKAGKSLYQPRWINPYLRTLGFQLHEQSLPRKAVLPLLKKNVPAVLPIRIADGITHPVYYVRYDGSKYHFENIKMKDSSEPDIFEFSGQKLSASLPNVVIVFSLVTCSSAHFDPIPILMESLLTLSNFYFDLSNHYRGTVTNEQVEQLSTTHLNALLKNMTPLVELVGDLQLARIMKSVYHNLTHVKYLKNGPPKDLQGYVPWSSVKICIHGLRELILDRLSALGVPDHVIDEKAKLVNMLHTHKTS